MSTRRTNWFISGQTAKKSLQRRDIHSILLSRAGQRPVNSGRGDILVLVNGEYVVVEKIQHELPIYKLYFENRLMM